MGEDKRSVVRDLIEKGNILLQNQEKPKFLDSHLQRITEGWDDSKLKAQERLKLLQDTKAAWEGYADGQDVIAAAFEKAEEEMSKIKKRFNLDSAKNDMGKRQEIYNKAKADLQAIHDKLQSDYKTMALTLPEDKKKLLEKELAAITEKMVIVEKFGEKVKVIEDFCNNLELFDNIKNHCHQMCPEDRVAVCMELQEDIAAKVTLIEESIAKEQELLPQGEVVPADALAHKEELERIHKFTLDLQEKVKKNTSDFSEDVKF